MRTAIRSLGVLCFAVALIGQEPAAKVIADGGVTLPPVDPITDRLRYEIALAQRDYLAARQQLDAIQRNMLAKTAEAEKACAGQQKAWSADAFTCVAEKK